MGEIWVVASVCIEALGDIFEYEVTDCGRRLESLNYDLRLGPIKEIVLNHKIQFNWLVILQQLNQGIIALIGNNPQRPNSPPPPAHAHQNQRNHQKNPQKNSPHKTTIIPLLDLSTYYIYS